MKRKIIEFLWNHPFLFDKFREYIPYLRGNSFDVLFLGKVLIHWKSENYDDVLKVIQIGANDGIRDDPLRKIILDYNCNAILLEPDPVAFSELQKAYSYLIRKGKDIKLLNIASKYNNDNDLIFYGLSEYARKIISRRKQIELSRKMSFLRERFINFLKREGYADVDKLVSGKRIYSITIPELFEKYFVPDLLVMDTEGLDWFLLDTINLEKDAPKIIFFEKGKPDINIDIKQRVIENFEEKGYYFTEFKHNIIITNLLNKNSE